MAMDGSLLWSCAEMKEKRLSEGGKADERTAMRPQGREEEGI
jgi:hypothetical protein